MISFDTLLDVLLAVLIGYLLGAIPVAALVSRYRGVDIFDTGTGLAGAANVFRNVGRKEGITVFLGDFAKGSLAVLIAYRLGLDGQMALLAATAVLFGHWYSLFTHFKGGDGLSSLLGVTLVMLPSIMVMGLAIAIVVFLVARRTDYHPTLVSGAAGYSFLVWRAGSSGGDQGVALGIVALALLVLGHGILSHRRQGTSPLQP